MFPASGRKDGRQVAQIQLHYDGAKNEDCVLQIVGIGPMKTTAAAQTGGAKK